MFNEENTQEDVTLENDIIEEEAEEVEETEETEEDTTDWKAEALKFKAILDRNKTKKTEKKTVKSKSDDFGYDVKAYLKASGIDASEFDFVQAEYQQSGFADVDQLLGNEYFQSRLEKERELKRTKDASPSGKRSGGVATDSVDYWLTKPFNEVPKEMKAKVVNAKQKQETTKGVFYNS